MKIKVRTLDPWREKELLPKIIDKGDWIDLVLPDSVKIKGITSDTLKKSGDSKVRKLNYEQVLIPLGVAMKLPKGFEAIIAMRSSSFKNYGIIQTNAIGIIDGKNF